MVFTEIAHQHRKHQESAWFLKCMVQLAMQASDTGLLKVIFEADSNTYWGFEAGAKEDHMVKKIHFHNS
jgi:hypothetical protein